MSNFLRKSFSRKLFLICALWIISFSAKSQTTLAPGDLAFVGYISTDDGANGTVQDDEFSFILLKDITTNTVIRFTDFGWLTAGGFQTANPCGANTGAINDGIITWTASSNLSCGTQVRIRCKYTLQASTGTVTGTQATNNNASAYISIANGGDQIFAYQGTHASPTLVAGISINKAWDAALTSCFFSSNSSVLPSALSSGANNAAISIAVNANYNCTVTAGSPASILAAINNPANWNKDNTFFAPIPAAFQLPVACSFSCGTATITVGAVTGTISACFGSPSASPNIQQFTTSGSGLTANITVTAPTNFEISLSPGSGYGTNLTLIQSGGNLPSTTIYVRSAASAPVGAINGNVTLSSTGATTQNVAVSGTIVAPPTTSNAGNDQTVCSTTATMSANSPSVGTGTWTQLAGPVTATIVSPNSATTSITGLNSPGTYTFRWTIANAPCPSSTDDVNIVVNTGPSITCPSNINISNLNGQCGNTASYSPTVTGTPAPTVSYTFTGSTTGSGSGTGSGSFFNVGTTTVTLTASNSCGSVNCSFTVTVNDTQPPTVTCPSNISVSNAPGQCGAIVNYPTPTASDNCPGVTVSGVPASGSFFPVGTTTVTITATDASGNTGTCTFTVTVNETEPPVATCPANITVPNDPNQCGAIVNYTIPPPGDNCPGVTASGSPASGSFFPVGTTTVTVTAIDASGNTATCTFTITVNDNQNPFITCPNNLTVSCASQVPAPNITSVTAADNCPGVTVTHVSDEISNQSCANRYTIVRTYRATDASGNMATCSQIITVNDQTAPSITCPAATTVSCASQVPAPNISLVTASDNCSGGVTVIHVSDVISNQTCANRYTITRTYRATDVCGNFAECTQTITVNDQTPPTLTCPAAVTVSCASQVPAPNIGSVSGVSDNCTGVVTVTHQGDVISNQTCPNRYTITRTYRATDACGNFAECTQTITVNDQTPPSLTCPVNVTVSCASQVPAPNIASVTGVSDNCGGIVTVTHISDVISNQTCPNRYTITRTYRATDVCGNFAECTQMITVNDQTAPTLTCPGPITVSCASQVPAPNPSLVTASDNCGGAVTVTHISDVISNQTCTNRFTITRTYRATDACGNFAQCTQTITVNDQTPPTLTCPVPINVSCASQVPAPNPSLVTTSDNCGGSVTVTHISDVISNQTCPNRFIVTRTYRATDACGNFAECTQTITVNDQTAPTMTCPAAVTVSCASQVPAPDPSLVIATDNCGGTVAVTHISDVISNQTCPNRFTITRTYRATDACGNFAQCTQTITVNDQTPPVITCSPNLVVNTPLGTCSAVVNFTVTATDNCGVVSVISVPASGSTFQIGTTTVTSTATDACGNTSTCTFTVTVNDFQLPVISVQPQGRNACVDDDVIFSVTAAPLNGPNNLTYQWQTFNGSSWVNIPGATNSSLAVNNVTLAMNHTAYRVLVIGLCTTVTSNTALLNVNPLPTISIVSSAPPILRPGETINLTAVVSPPGGTIQWLKNGVPIPGATSLVLSGLTVDDIGVYTAVYIDINGCTMTSASLEITGEPLIRLFIYPSPTNGQFQVRFNNTPGQHVVVNVYDSKGRLVIKQSETTGIPYTSIHLDLSNHQSGVYLVEVWDINGARIGVGKVVVSH